MSAELAVVRSADDIAQLPPAERGAMITAALRESKAWLTVATQGTDPTPIAEFVAWSSAVAEMTRQLNLSQEIQLDAQEMARRAERGLGVAIRNGQHAGRLRKQGETTRKSQGAAVLPDQEKGSPADYLRSSSQIDRVYSVTDNVTDEEHDQAIAAARAEGNLSSANVVRKLRHIPNPPKRAGVKRDRYRYIRREAFANIRDSLNSIGTLLEATDGLDPDIGADERAQWAADLTRARRNLSPLIKLLLERQAT